MNREFALSPTVPTLILFVFGMITFLTGCQDKNASATNGNVTDVTAPAPAYASTSTQYQPAPQPVTYDTMPNASNNNNGSTAGSFGGNTYTVKKGDTLYAIARAKYGDGKQWQRIAQANPGLSPSSLKVGQTITVP